MQLIIAEKPSLGRNIADAIGGMTRRNGYMEGRDYLVTWVFGHVFELADIEYYNPRPAGARGWSFDNIPCFPHEFVYRLKEGDDGVKRQFDLIRSLCNRPDVTAVVNAGDADREGEIIVRTCVRRALAEPKPQLRLWLPDQTADTIRQALADLPPDEGYDNLANEGYARTYIDWLWGTNLTRYATLLTGRLLRVGRVIVPIVKAIYDRDLAIRNFRPTTYYGVASRTVVKGEELLLTSREEFDRDHRADAQALADAYNALPTVVTDKKSTVDYLPPGKLYALSTLQNVLGKKYKMSMKDSLAIVQTLYERGFLTYPRTNSEYLATAEKDKVRRILSGVGKLGYPVAFRDSKYIFDDSKIESHSALTPTYKIPAAGDLNEREKQVYSTVFRRFVAVFCQEPCRVEKSELHLKTGDREEFILRGTAIVQPGWTKYDDYARKDKFLPPLEIGETVETAFSPQEKETAPPKHYTIETLNNYLKNPFREEKAAAKQEDRAAGAEGEEDAEDYRAIFEGLELGTEATRTGIIDNARTSRYITLNKDTYLIEPEGEFLIETLSRIGIVMDKYKTSEMGRALKRVFRGEITVEESTHLAEDEIRAIFAKRAEAEEAVGLGSVGEVIGECPLCGGKVVRGNRAYGCTTPECPLRIGVTICHRNIAPDEVRALLRDGHTPPLDGFLSKNGKRFSAPLRISAEGKVTFDFPEQKEGERVPDCRCPVCGKPMAYGRFGYACSAKKCGFRVGGTILGRKIEEDTLRVLCGTGITPPLDGFVSQKNGKAFTACLALRAGRAQIVPVNAGAPSPEHDMPAGAAGSRGGTTKKKKQTDAAKPAAIGACPLCGAEVVRGRQNWGCMGYTRGCTFRIPFTIAGHGVTEAEAKQLVKNGKTTRLCDLTGPDGAHDRARLIIRDGVVTPDRP